jgi:Fuc2NAc and GlcNAc transferase
MDGIDGIAAAEALFVVGAGALLSTVSASGITASYAAIVFGAACLGFLIWNWAPARIFMGDVGSGYLGYVIAVLGIASARDNPATLLSWLIRGERAYEAHRSHAYQWLARRWHSHSRVTIAATAINICWLLPCALFAMAHPQFAAWSTVGAFTPLILLVLFTGAGRAEK